MEGKIRRRRSLYYGPLGRLTRRPVAVGILCAVLLSASFGGVFAYVQSQIGVGTAISVLPTDSLVYDRNGKLIADLHPPGASRRPVPYQAIAPRMRNAIVAIEDRNFWNEGSVDLPRLVASAVYDVTHHTAAQGGSTITEQLAKVLYLNDSKTIRRKLQEMFLGQQLSSQLSKQQILNEYLNDVYFGHGATGVEAASEIYFGVPASRLDLAESAMLAGLPNAPSYLDPLQHLPQAKARQRQVLDAMVQAHQISQAQADAAYQERLPLSNGRSDDLDLFPAFTGRVVQEIASQLHVDPTRAGLTIRTTLDSGLEAAAEQAVERDVAQLRWQDVSDGALVSTDPQTGDVLAYVGSAGPGHPGSQIDMAATPRQPGSTIKVVTYTAAIAARKVTPLTPVSDGPLTLPSGGGPDGSEPYFVHDYDYRYHGILPVEVALGNSFNIPAVRVEQAVGIGGVLDLARKLGITTFDKPDSDYGLSLTLGGYPVPLWELAQGYGALADGGVLHPARFLLSVKAPDGRELLPPPPPGQQVLDPGVAFVMNQMLSDDNNRTMEFGRGTDLVIPGHQVAAKTGTTNDNRDALTVGWTPRFLTAAWVGNANNQPMTGVIGLTGGAPMWHDIMQRGLGHGSDDWPSPPSDVYRAYSGGREAWLLDGTSPAGPVLGGQGSRRYPFWDMLPGSDQGNGDRGQNSDQGPGFDQGSDHGRGCRTWTFQGGQYYACGSGPSGLPGDPGAGGSGDSGGGG
jgi:membrane peptidoglycan carboxypeptidase